MCDVVIILPKPIVQGSNSSAKSALISAVPLLPDPLLFRVFDALENPFELFPLRRVSRATAKYVQLKLQVVSKVNLKIKNPKI